MGRGRQPIKTLRSNVCSSIYYDGETSRIGRYGDGDRGKEIRRYTSRRGHIDRLRVRATCEVAAPVGKLEAGGGRSSQLNRRAAIVEAVAGGRVYANAAAGR